MSLNLRLKSAVSIIMTKVDIEKRFNALSDIEKKRFIQYVLLWFDKPAQLSRLNTILTSCENTFKK